MGEPRFTRVLRVLVAVWLVVGTLASPGKQDGAMVDDCERRREMVATICKLLPQQCSQATTDSLVLHGCSTTSGHLRESTERALLASMELHQEKAEKAAHKLGVARPRCHTKDTEVSKTETNPNSSMNSLQLLLAPRGPQGGTIMLGNSLSHDHEKCKVPFAHSLKCAAQNQPTLGEAQTGEGCCTLTKALEVLKDAVSQNDHEYQKMKEQEKELKDSLQSCVQTGKGIQNVTKNTRRSGRRDSSETKGAPASNCQTALSKVQDLTQQLSQCTSQNQTGSTTVEGALATPTSNPTVAPTAAPTATPTAVPTPLPEKKRTDKQKESDSSPPYEVQELGSGYCADYIYLPEGKYPPRH